MAKSVLFPPPGFVPLSGRLKMAMRKMRFVDRVFQPLWAGEDCNWLRAFLGTNVITTLNAFEQSIKRYCLNGLVICGFIRFY